MLRASDQPGQKAARPEVAEEDHLLTAALWDSVLHYLNERDEHGGEARSAAECTKMVSLWLSIEALVPRSIQLVAAAGPDLSDNEHLDLLRALVALGPQWWAGRPTFFRDLQRALRTARIEDEAIAASWATLVSAVANDRDGGGD